VVASLVGVVPLRDQRGESIANMPVLYEALREISEGWLSGPEAAERAHQAFDMLECVVVPVEA